MSNLVYINEEGLFLSVHEVSSHAPQKQHSFNWGVLNDASTFKNAGELCKLSFKEEKPKPVTFVGVEVTRIVKIIKEQ